MEDSSNERFGHLYWYSINDIPSTMLEISWYPQMYSHKCIEFLYRLYIVYIMVLC